MMTQEGRVLGAGEGPQVGKTNSKRAFLGGWMTRSCSMKSLSSAEAPKLKSRRKVPKPLMEKRRRERINSSLECLRLLMLENTQNEKLKNPKVEKAEILESVVEFLSTEKVERSHQGVREVMSGSQRSSGLQQSYHDGMRSCLLRVSQFISSKSRDPEQSGSARGRLALSEPLAASSGLLHSSPVPASLSPAPQHLTLQPGSSKLSPSATAPVTAHVSDPVWRPWPM
nr:hairy-related 5 [Nothobranchius furzeri]